MAVTVKKVVLWRRELDNRPGALAGVLEPLARAGADLQIAMGYRLPGNESQAVVELAPVTGKKSTALAQDAGLQPSAIPALIATGDNRPGLGYALSRGMADARINMAFLVAQVMGRKYSAIFGFESAADADRAVAVIKTAARAKAAPAKKAARAKRKRHRR